MEKSRPVSSLLLPSLTGASVRRGVWSADEHDRFLQALKRFPEGPWQQLALCVGTRSTRQVQTHAQKFFEKIRRRQRGLRRSYVHTGMAREHRVDDDVVAILASMPTSDHEDNDEDDDEQEEEEENESENSNDENEAVNSDYEAKSESIEATASSVSSSSTARTPKPKGKRKRSQSQKNSKEEATPRTLPRRIRIRRSARNASHLAVHRDQLFMNLSSALEREGNDGTEEDGASTVPSIEPVDPTEANLPSIEEALDFFLNNIDAEGGSTTHHLQKL